MILKKYLVKLSLTLFLIFCFFEISGQEHKIFKHFDKSTLINVEIDYDKDGDLDFIYVGVIADRNQGRVYLIENRGSKLGNPEYIFSYPTIAVKQTIVIEQIGNLISINLIGTSPDNIKTKFVANINKGKFQGLLSPPATSNTLKKN